MTIVMAALMPKGFFPTEDIGQISVNAEAVEDISFPAMSELLQRVGRTVREDPSVDTVVMGADASNNGRMFISLKPRGERLPMDKVLEDLRRAVRVIPGVNVYFNPIQNLRLGGRVSESRLPDVINGLSPGRLQGNSQKMLVLIPPDPIFRT